MPGVTPVTLRKAGVKGERPQQRPLPRLPCASLPPAGNFLPRRSCCVSKERERMGWEWGELGPDTGLKAELRGASGAAWLTRV